MAGKIPLALMATWLLIVPHVLVGLISLGGFFSVFFYTSFGTQFIAGVIVNMVMVGGALLSCAALFDPGPFRGAIKVFRARILAALWNFLNAVWLGYLILRQPPGEPSAMLAAQLALAVVTLCVLLLYAAEDDEAVKARKQEAEARRDGKKG